MSPIVYETDEFARGNSHINAVRSFCARLIRRKLDQIAVKNHCPSII